MSLDHEAPRERALSHHKIEDLIKVDMAIQQEIGAQMSDLYRSLDNDLKIMTRLTGRQLQTG